MNKMLRQANAQDPDSSKHLIDFLPTTMNFLDWLPWCSILPLTTIRDQFQSQQIDDSKKRLIANDCKRGVTLGGHLGQNMVAPITAAFPRRVFESADRSEADRTSDRV